MAVTFAQIPEQFRDWLFGEELIEREADIFEFLTTAELKRVHRLLSQVYTHDISVSTFADEVQRIVPGKRGKQVVLDVLGYNLIRIQDWFQSENIPDLIRELGGDPASFRTLLSVHPVIEDVLKDTNVDVIPPRSRGPVEKRMVDFLNHSIDDGALLESMMKSPKIGGWGWDQNVAAPVVDALQVYRDEAEEKHAMYVTEDRFAEVERERQALRAALQREMPPEGTAQTLPDIPSPKKLEATPVAASSQATDIESDVPDAFLDLFQDNVPTAEGLPERALPDPFTDLLAILDEEIQAKEKEVLTVEKEGVLEVAPEEVSALFEHRRVPDEEIPKTPFEKALHESDLLLERELHAVEQKKEQLMSGVPDATIAVSAVLEALLNHILSEANFAMSDAHLKKRVRSILGSRLRDIRGSEETARLLLRIGNGHPELDRAMVEKLMELTEASFLEFQRKVIERGLQRERARQIQQREEILEQKREELFQEERELNDRFRKLTGTDAPISFPLPDEHTKQPALQAGSVATATAVRSAPVVRREVQVTLSPQSIVAKAGDKPIMGDIQYERQLSGPTEELRRMRLTDFRRLAKDPAAAAKKVFAKIELLNAEGFAKRVQGIQAWRTSPVMTLYLAVTREALDQGTPLAAVLVERKKATPEMLTLEECTAIRELNAQLRT